MHEVSLYIPCFNAEQTISKCLGAVLDQSHPLKEVVVVDDGSSDATNGIVSRYPVRYIRHEHNRGLAAARNTAIRHIDTEFVASLDSDCVPEKDWLGNLMKGFDSAPAAGIGGKLIEEFCIQAPDLWRSVHMKQYWEARDAEPPFLFGSNTVFRREALLAVGLYNEGLRNNYEDVDICERLKKKGHALIYEPRAISRHLRKDTVPSLLDRFWEWHVGFYRKKGFYSTPEKFLVKIEENIGLANRYIEEDMAKGMERLLYLDLLLGFHHSLKDLAYYISPEAGAKRPSGEDRLLTAWLVLLDLVFFYRLDAVNRDMPTLMPQKLAVLQNFFALDLVAGRLINDTFKSRCFKRMFYSDLLDCLCGARDDSLSGYLLRLVESNPDWNGYLRRSHAGLNLAFLENMCLQLEKWLQHLKYRLPGLVPIIEESTLQEEA